MSDIFLHGKTAVKIKAKELVVWDKSTLYDCEGDKKWISKKYSEYNKEEQTLIIEEWLYNKIFKIK